MILETSKVQKWSMGSKESTEGQEGHKGVNHHVW